MRKRGTTTQKRLQSPLTLREHFYSDGILCDVNILLNAMKVTSEDGKSGRAETGVNNGKGSRSSKLAEAMEICLADVLNGFSKEELKNYIMQLLLNTCALNDLNDAEYPLRENMGGREEISNHPSNFNRHPQAGDQSYQPNRSTFNTAMESDPQMGYPYNFPSNSNRGFSEGGSQKRKKNSTSQCCSETSACTNGNDCGRFFTISDHSSTNHETSNFNRIMKLLDLICEMRPFEYSRPRCWERAKDTEVRECGAARNARRRLFRQEPPHWSSNSDCQPLPPQTPPQPEDQPFTFTDCMQGTGQHGFPPFHTPGSQQQGQMYQQGFTQHLSHCSQSATPSLRPPFERSNLVTVVPQRQQPRMHTRTDMRGPDSPPSTTSQPKSPPILKPRNRTPQRPLGGQPCPLVTPRMALDNPYLRMNKTL